MSNEDALMALGQYLHQDAATDASSEADLARNVIALMSKSERAALMTYLASALDRFSPSELKGKLNRATTDLRFTSKGADAFLRAAFSQLDTA